MQPYDTYENGVYKNTYPSGDNSRSDSWSRAVRNQFNLQASYEKGIDGHHFKVLGGMQTDELTNNSFGTTVTDFRYPGYTLIGQGKYTEASSSGSFSEWAMLSYLARINYNYNERYLLELNGRWDASSRFHKDNRLGFFPSVSAGWRISEETFFEPLKDQIDNLKLRVSYGTLGNQEIGGYYPYSASINAGAGYWFDYKQGTGVTQSVIANSAISWEKSSQINIGLDANFLNSRLAFTFDVYNRKVFDMLQQFPIPSYVGLTSSWENKGDMENKGWELSLTWRDKIQDFNYSITANLSDVKNKVTKLYGRPEYKGSETDITITREGIPLASYFGYEAEGLYQTQEEIDNSAVYGDKKGIKPGYVKYKDQLTEDTDGDGIPDAGDGVINDKDRVVLGSNMPRYEYSLNLAADWKGFDLSLFLQGVGKKDLFYTGYGVRPFLVGRTMFKHQLDYWTEDNRDAQFPILLIEGSQNSVVNNKPSSFWMKSGAFLRLKNITLGYTIPSKLTHKIGISNLRVYANAQNLFTASEAYKGYDPEISFSSGSFYPLMQTFTFGVNIDF